jgi:hypothetical protein
VWQGVKNAFRLAGGFLSFLIPIIVLIVENIPKHPKTLQEVFMNDPATFWAIIAVSVFWALVLIPCIAWEFVRVFPRIEILAQNDTDVISILIFNHEPVNLEEPSVILDKRYWVMKNGLEHMESIDKSNMRFTLDENKIEYDDHLVVKIADAGGGYLRLLLRKPEDLKQFEIYDNVENAIYKLELLVKGKIDGRPIFPKRFKKKFRLWRQEDIVNVNGQLIHSTPHDLKWIENDVSIASKFRHSTNRQKG